MKWYYLWRLRRANVRLSKALHALPDYWADHPEENLDEIVEWACAHSQVKHYLEKLEP
jgi:hypothetical protein